MRLLRLWILIFAFVTSAACESDVLGSVLAGFGAPGTGDSAMSLGDTARLIAIGETRGWPSRVKYDSRLESTDFQWTSSITSVATIDASGLVTATGVGTTFLTASSEGVTGIPVLLYVTRTATAVRVVTNKLEMRVGDTLNAVLEGVGPAGETVDGV